MTSPDDSVTVGELIDLARTLLKQMPRCERGQCRHFATQTVRNGIFALELCDLHALEYAESCRTAYDHAPLIRRAVAMLGPERCDYCRKEPRTP